MASTVYETEISGGGGGGDQMAQHINGIWWLSEAIENATFQENFKIWSVLDGFEADDDVA